jgi:hypothetical protein
MDIQVNLTKTGDGSEYKLMYFIDGHNCKDDPMSVEDFRAKIIDFLGKDAYFKNNIYLSHDTRSTLVYDPKVDTIYVLQKMLQSAGQIHELGI